LVTLSLSFLTRKEGEEKEERAAEKGIPIRGRERRKGGVC